jgi:hypothetical protein
LKLLELRLGVYTLMQKAVILNTYRIIRKLSSVLGRLHVLFDKQLNRCEIIIIINVMYTYMCLYVYLLFERLGMYLRVPSDGITFIRSFVKIRQLVQKFKLGNHAYAQEACYLKAYFGLFISESRLQIGLVYGYDYFNDTKI